MFVICVPLSISCTVTWNDNVFTSCGAKFMLIPLFKSFSTLSKGFPSRDILPSSNVVPLGTVSFTFTLVGAVPRLLSNLIVYVILSPAFTSVPALSDSLVTITFGLFTVSCTEFVFTSFTVAVFEICFSNVPSGNVFTLTWKVKVVCPRAGTSTSIPFCKFKDVNSFLSSSLIFMLSCTKLVPSGIGSFIVAFPSKSPLFLTVILYVITSPSTT